MKKIAHHLMLVAGPSHSSCRKQVKTYFARTELVRYDQIEIDEAATLSAVHRDFDGALADGLNQNRRILEGLIRDLQDTGIAAATDLLKIRQGYQSKVLHIATHFLDGFIGIDSFFYNLIDDSHWLPEQTQQAIAADPEEYWLIPVNGFSESPEKAALIHQ